MDKEYKYMVAVRCFTYNHASFIGDALRGFEMQRATFPTITIVVDDASPDGEQEILKKWAESHLVTEVGNDLWRTMPYGRLAFGTQKENSLSNFAILLLADNHFKMRKAKMPYIMEWVIEAKYHAVCEGDDYWTDPLKLQKQVVFMEGNPDYMLSFHAIMEKYEGRPERDHIRKKIEDREYSGVEWYKTRPSQFASFLFRSSLFTSDYYRQVLADCDFVAGDVPLLLSCAHLGRLRGFSDVMSVYRHNETGWTQKQRSKEELMRIINSQLHYSKFGKEFEPLAMSFYNRECVRAFINSFRDKPDYSYLCLSWKKSKLGTLKALFSVLWSIVKSNVAYRIR